MNAAVLRKLEELGRALAELEHTASCPDCRRLVELLVGMMLQALVVAQAELAGGGPSTS